MEKDREKPCTDEPGAEMVSRRNFLIGLKKWSRVIIGAALVGAAALDADEDAEAAGAWVNGGGRGWVNRYGGGGAWANGGGEWANRVGAGGAWANGGGAWVNRRW